MRCHATCTISYMQHLTNMDNIFSTYNFTSMKIVYQTKYFHTQHVILSSNNTQNGPISDPQKQGHHTIPFTILNHAWFHLSPTQENIKIYTKPENINPRIKTKPSNTSETVRNQSQNFLIFSPKILGLKHWHNSTPKDSLCH